MAISTTEMHGGLRSGTGGVSSIDSDTEFQDAVSVLLPGPIVCRSGDVDSLQAPLHPEEAAFVQAAVPRRVREFTAGRSCARAALEQLGFRNIPVRMGARRQPLWPRGVIGSISHGAGYCLAAVALRTRLAGVGVDIEQAAPLTESLLDLVCTPAERAQLSLHPAGMRGLVAKLMFSAKESVFKCLYPHFGIELDFQEVELDVDLHHGHFVAQVSRLALNAVADLPVHGRLACTSRAVITVALLHDDDIEFLSRPNPARAMDGCTGRYVCGWNE